MDGTLSGTVSGKVYYRLSLTNCTASGDTSNYSGNSYAAQGNSVTLTSTTPAGYKFDSWLVTPDSVTISNNSFTMPGSAVAVTANTTQMVKITQQPVGKNVTYGESVTLSVTAENSSGNTTGITYQWYKGNGKLSGETNATLTLSTPGAGTNNYYCEVTYGGCTIKSNTATVTVDEADSTVTKAPAAVGNLVYNGSAQELVTAGTATGGTMWYSLDGTNWKDNIPTGTNAGTYTVWYKVAGDSNHNDSAPASVTVTIAPKPVTVSGITASDKTYDGSTAATLVYTDAEFDGKVYSDTLTVTATGAFTDKNAGTGKTVNITNMALGGDSAANYILATNGQQTETTATISPKSIAPTIVVTGTYTYTGDPITPTFTVKDGETPLTEGDYTAVVTDNTAAGTGTITVTAKEGGNYIFESAQKTFTITPASQSATVILDGGALDGIVGTDDVSDTMPTTGTIETADAGDGKTVHFDDITLTGDKAGNYTVTQPTVTMNISKADPDVGTVTKASPATIYTTTPLNSISLDKTGATAGTLKLTDDQTLTAGTADYGWTFTPTDTTNYNCCGVSERASDSLRGHWYAPCSRRLYSRMKPSFSQYRPLMRSRRLPQNRNSVLVNGSSSNCCWTILASPSIPLRRSV